ncbi:MAG: hypothetical protein EBQ99_11325, partial [Planctomycetes bacterium]|nr:hypothetical protein [Planctomycetota bacterium]
HWHVLGLTGLSVVAVGCFQWFASHDRQAWAAWTYLGLMLLAVAWYALLRRRRLEWVFVHARAMAEALRVQLAWTAAGVDDVVTDHYMSRRSIDTRFLREMIRAASIEAFVDAPGDAGGLAQEASGLAWVQGQIEYMAGRTEHDAAPSRLGHWVARLRRWSIQVVRGAMRAWWILILLVSLAMAVVSSGATPGAEHGSHDDHGGSLVAWLPFGAFLIGTLIFVKVGLEYHDGVVLAEEDEESYRRMLPVFRRAHALLGRADDTAERRRILRAVGKEALDEHAEWFVNHRHSLRMPSVG